MARRKRSNKPPQNKVFRGMKSRYLVITFKSLVTLAVLVSLGGLAWWLFKGQFFEISQINCHQGEGACSEEIASLFKGARGKNIFLYQAGNLKESALKQQPALSQVEVKKKLPNTLKIVVGIRKPFALLVDLQGEMRVVDLDGVVLPVNSSEFTGPRLRVTSLPVLGEAVVNPQSLKGLKLIELLNLSYIPFEEVWLSDEVSLTTELTNETLATFSAQKDLLPQVDSLQYILHHSRMEDKAITGIDLRFQKPIITFSQLGKEKAAKL